MNIHSCVFFELGHEDTLHAMHHALKCPLLSLHCLFRRLRSDFVFSEIDTKNSHGDLSKERDAIPDQSRGIKLIQLKG